MIFAELTANPWGYVHGVRGAMLAMLAMFRNPQGTKQGTFPPWNGIRRWLLHRLVRRFIRHGRVGH